MNQTDGLELMLWEQRTKVADLQRINAELLHALERMVAVFDGPGGTDSPTCINARAVIAQAKGQQ